MAQAAAEFGAANDAVDAAAAQALGVNRTDLRVLGIVQQAGGTTAGEAAFQAGLSPSALTTAVQRLVRSGYLVREVDAADRRRVTLRLTDVARARIRELYDPVHQEGLRLLASLPTESIPVIEHFLEQSAAHLRRQAGYILTRWDGDAWSEGSGGTGHPG